MVLLLVSCKNLVRDSKRIKILDDFMIIYITVTFMVYLHLHKYFLSTLHLFFLIMDEILLYLHGSE